MTGNDTARIRQDPRAKLSALRRDHPACEIRLITAEVWEAVSRPAPGQTVVHCADSLDGLRGKIESDAR
jgi:hypothetical protein